MAMHAGAMACGRSRRGDGCLGRRLLGRMQRGAVSRLAHRLDGAVVGELRAQGRWQCPSPHDFPTAKRANTSRSKLPAKSVHQDSSTM